jgi:hypothetical protein
MLVAASWLGLCLLPCRSPTDHRSQNLHYIRHKKSLAMGANQQFQEHLSSFVLQPAGIV